MLSATDIRDDMEIILRNNVGAPPATEPDFLCYDYGAGAMRGDHAGKRD